MPTYAILSHFTDQGIKNINDTLKRADAFKAAAKTAGVTVKELLWTQGHYDVISIVEGPDDAVAALGLTVAKLGNIKSETLRGFTATDMEKILTKVK